MRELFIGLRWMFLSYSRDSRLPNGTVHRCPNGRCLVDMLFHVSFIYKYNFVAKKIHMCF